MSRATEKRRKHLHRVRRPSPPAPFPHAGEGRKVGAPLLHAGEGSRVAAPLRHGGAGSGGVGPHDQAGERSQTPRPDQPPWLPVGIDLDFVPPAVRQAIGLIIEPAYRQFVLQAADAMERSLGLTMVHLLWLELLSQTDLARDYAEVISVLKLPINVSGLMAEYMKLVHVKLKVGAFLLRLQEFREKHGRVLIPCQPMQAYPGECRQVGPEWTAPGCLGDDGKAQISPNHEQRRLGRLKPGLQRGENGRIGENVDQLGGEPVAEGRSGTETGPFRQNNEQRRLSRLKPGLQRGENGTIGENVDQLGGVPVPAGRSATENDPDPRNDEQLGDGFPVP